MDLPISILSLTEQIKFKKLDHKNIRPQIVQLHAQLSNPLLKSDPLMAAIVNIIERCMEHLDDPNLEQLSLLELAGKKKVVFLPGSTYSLSTLAPDLAEQSASELAEQSTSDQSTEPVQIHSPAQTRSMSSRIESQTTESVLVHNSDGSHTYHSPTAGSKSDTRASNTQVEQSAHDDEISALRREIEKLKLQNEIALLKTQKSNGGNPLQHDFSEIAMPSVEDQAAQLANLDHSDQQNFEFYRSGSKWLASIVIPAMRFPTFYTHVTDGYKLLVRAVRLHLRNSTTDIRKLVQSFQAVTPKPGESVLEFAARWNDARTVLTEAGGVESNYPLSILLEKIDMFFPPIGPHGETLYRDIKQMLKVNRNNIHTLADLQELHDTWASSDIGRAAVQSITSHALSSSSSAFNITPAPADLAPAATPATTPAPVTLPTDLGETHRGIPINEHGVNLCWGGCMRTDHKATSPKQPGVWKCPHTPPFNTYYVLAKESHRKYNQTSKAASKAKRAAAVAALATADANATGTPMSPAIPPGTGADTVRSETATRRGTDHVLPPHIQPFQHPDNQSFQQPTMQQANFAAAVSQQQMFHQLQQQQVYHDQQQFQQYLQQQYQLQQQQQQQLWHQRHAQPPVLQPKFMGLVTSQPVPSAPSAHSLTTGKSDTPPSPSAHSARDGTVKSGTSPSPHVSRNPYGNAFMMTSSASPMSSGSGVHRVVLDSGADSPYTGRKDIMSSFAPQQPVTVAPYSSDPQASVSITGSGTYGGIQLQYSPNFPPNTTLVPQQWLVSHYGGYLVYMNRSLVWYIGDVQFQLAILEQATGLLRSPDPDALAQFTLTLPRIM